MAPRTKINILNNPIGVFSYLLLPNHLIWNILKKDERTALLEICRSENNKMYADPKNYDREHKSPDSPMNTKNGRIISRIMGICSPESVLEIGPGSGFYTELLLGFPSVKNYIGVDITETFVDYLKANLLPKYHGGKKVNFVCGDLLKQDFSSKFDLIIFISSLHHIPNRTEVIQKCKDLLTERGRIIIIEPRHGIPRVLTLIRKIFRNYCKRSYWQDASNLVTHHFMTFSEIKYIAKKSGLKIQEMLFFDFKGEKYLDRIKKTRLGFFSCYYFVPLALFSHYVYAMFAKKDPARTR